MAKVKTGKFAMENEDWQDISKEAKSLIKKLLEKDTKKRLSAH